MDSMSDESPDLAGGKTSTKSDYPNLSPFSRLNRERTVEMAKRGGIASGVARRERKTMREAAIELLHTLIGDDGDTIGKNIVLAMALEAKRGNVPAARFLAELTGDLGTDPSKIKADELPPPVTIGIHDPDFIERERKRQEELRTVDVEAVEVKANTPEHPEESPDSTPGGPQDAPWAGDGRAPTPDGQRPQGAVVDAPAAKPQPKPTAPTALPPPRTPSEARARMRAAQEAEERSRPENRTQAPRPTFLPAGFQRRR